MDCEHCPYAAKIEQLLHDSESNKEAHKEFYKRFEGQGQAQAVTNERYNTIITTLNGLTAKVETLSSNDGKKWRSASMSVITTLIGAIVGFGFSALMNIA